MIYKKNYPFFLLIFLLSACNQGLSEHSGEKGSSGEANESAIADSIENQMTALSYGNFSDRKFIRSSAITFRVENVKGTMQAINEIVQKAGGFVIYSKLNSQINQRAVSELSSDSSVESIQYTVQNDMRIRVPTIRFDSVLAQIIPLAYFIDDQVLQLDDVSFQVLSNHMTIRRAVAPKKQKGAAELNAYQQEEADRARIDNLSLNDRIRYSDVSLHFSQRPLVQQTFIANEERAMQYQPGFGRKILQAFSEGWHLIEWLLLTLIQAWSLLLAGIIAWFLYRKVKQRTN